MVEKKGKSPKLSSGQQAAALAEQIREEMQNRKNVSAGAVIGGDPENWSYTHVPNDPMVKDRLEAKLRGLGFILCEDGEAMAGMHSGRLWKVPKIIKKERLKQRHELFRKKMES